MKKFLSLMLVFSFLVPLMCMPILSSAEEVRFQSLSVQYEEVNSSSADLIDVDKNAIAIVRDNLRNHVSNFSITVDMKSVSQESMKSYANSVFTKAIEHSGNPIEGDYIYYQIGSNGYQCSLYSTYIGYKMDINYTVSYFVTKQQENELDKKVVEILNSLNLKNKNDYEKIKSIYDYLTSHVTYDYDAYEKELGNPDNTSLVPHSAYSALCKGTAVCQGYANALYRLLLSSGIDCRIISGFSNGQGHAWNIAAIDGEYFLLDSTWDTGRQKYSYFLCGKSNFPNHTFDTKFKTAEFTNKYPISKIDYSLKVTDHTDTDKFSDTDKGTDTDESSDTDKGSDTNRVTRKIGDVDGDGIITSFDSLRVLRISVQLDKINDAEFELADVHYDGQIDSVDALEILRYSVKLISADSKLGSEINIYYTK